MDDLEQLLAEWEEAEARAARIASEAKLMWLVLGAIYNMIRDDDVVRIVAGSETDKVISEIVNRVEGR